MNKTFITIIFISWSFISLASADNRKTFNVYSKLLEPEHTKLLVEKLKENNISYVKKDNGEVWYASEHQDFVSHLTKNMVSADLPVNRSINYAQPFSRNLFTSQLKSKGIPYEVKVRNNINWIVWDKKYTSDVNKIKVLVEKKSNEYFTKQIQLQLDKK